MTYPDEAFAKWLGENFVPVRIDVKKEADLAKKWGVIWTPWLLVIDETEARVAWTVGPFSPRDYRSWLEGVLADNTAFHSAEQNLSATPDVPELNSLVGRLALGRGDYAKAVKCLKEATKGIGPDRPEVCSQLCTALGRAAAHTGDEAALKHAMECNAKCGKGGEGWIALEKAHVLLQAGKFEEAQKAYEGFVKEHEKDPAAPEAWYWLGVASYEATHKPDGLLDAWKKLTAATPDNPWAQRVQMALTK